MLSARDISKTKRSEGIIKFLAISNYPLSWQRRLNEELVDDQTNLTFGQQTLIDVCFSEKPTQFYWLNVHKITTVLYVRLIIMMNYVDYT